MASSSASRDDALSALIAALRAEGWGLTDDAIRSAVSSIVSSPTAPLPSVGAVRGALLMVGCEYFTRSIVTIQSVCCHRLGLCGWVWIGS
jgi:hypothetical protein